MEGTPPSLFYELPMEIHPLIFLQMDLQTVGNACCVCQMWSGLGTESLIRSICTQKGLQERFKPASRGWKWVVLSKRPVKECKDDEHGLGSKTFPFGLYEGEWKGSQRHGIGVFYWSSIEDFDVVYVGEWQDDARCGEGTCIWNTGDQYVGTWLDEKASGQGTFTWSTGSSYTGGWSNGVQHGKGIFKWKHGDSYDGDWVDGKQTGKGVFRWTSGNVYEGDWFEDTKTGKGKFTWAGGDNYDGDWVNNKKEGRGIFNWMSGDRYEGEFSQNKKEGYGVFTWENGDKYEGYWAADKKNGTGKFTWATGDWYDGGWCENKKHGKGVYQWINGDKFEGEWIMGKQTGFGINTWANKNIFEGMWEDGEKREGIYTEAVSQRKFKAPCATDKIDLTLLHPDLQRAIAEKRCTYTETKENCYFQYLWETKENVDRTHGVCYSCREHCVPKHNIKLLDPKKFHFGGNFYCDCGFGFLDNPCSLKHH
eukprot:TRINITY_DN3944_c0_g1_i1.p1 TRINITY_DN3944_c0_g1~~TRINITY_DN3944_c0_g1_i1.p1  ORF type:complete len:479 (+),score=84.16 TRINITY_DN3944_c0_g1_i1:14-1450(+)